MANFVIVDPFVGMGPVTATHTSAQAPLGIQVRAVDKNTGTANLGAGIFQYCVGSSTASAVSSSGQFVMIRANTAQLLLDAQSTAIHVPIGLAAGVLSNTNVYGWVQVQGMADYGMASASNYAEAAHAAKYVADAGHIVSGVTVGKKVIGLFNPVSNASGTANSRAFTYHLNFPILIGNMSATNAGGY